MWESVSAFTVPHLGAGEMVPRLRACAVFLLQNWFRFPATAWQLSTICYCSLRGSGALFVWPPRTSDTHAMYLYAGMQNIAYKTKINKSKLFISSSLSDTS